MHEAINDAINAAAQPTETDILAARQAILTCLADGQVIDTYILASAVSQRRDLSPPGDQKVRLPSLTPSSNEIYDEPGIVWIRNFSRECGRWPSW